VGKKEKMKKVLFTLFVMLSLFGNTQTSYADMQISVNTYTPSNPYVIASVERPTINLNLTSSTRLVSYGYNDSKIPLGVGMMLGGVTFVTAGLLTIPDYDVGPNGETQTKPFWRQGARMLAVMTGAGLFKAGIVISISR
jgi:hypothetical protein